MCSEVCDFVQPHQCREMQTLASCKLGTSFQRYEGVAVPSPATYRYLYGVNYLTALFQHTVQRQARVPRHSCCCSRQDTDVRARSVSMQIAKRRVAHMEKRPDAKIIPLGIGDTTEPLTETVAKAMADHALGMGTREGYSGCDRTPA